VQETALISINKKKPTVQKETIIEPVSMSQKLALSILNSPINYGA
jgi:hypothetical protein